MSVKEPAYTELSRVKYSIYHGPYNGSGTKLFVWTTMR